MIKVKPLCVSKFVVLKVVLNAPTTFHIREQAIYIYNNVILLKLNHKLLPIQNIKSMQTENTFTKPPLTLNI